MNCEQYVELLSDLMDGALSADERDRIESHLSVCVACAEVHEDFISIVGFCRDNRGQYDAVPNERAMWLRITNIIEAESARAPSPVIPQEAGWWFRLMNRSWQVSFPQIAGAVAVLVLVVSVAAVLSVRGISGSGGPGVQQAGLGLVSNNMSVEDRYRQQQQTIAYWNQRVELNKARWNPQMRETFDTNMSVIDAAVTNSMTQLRVNPHDEVSEQILTDALNDKIALLKEFSDL
jgi:anti-sigma factor RsiW